MFTSVARLMNKKEAPSGQLIDVGGFKLHLHCTGPVNNHPTVIIEGGAGCTTGIYHWLQEKLAEQVQVCTYDRAGLGWSEDSREPHDAEHMAMHLQTLLDNAGLSGPYVFVGHSLAGLILRVYAGKYPEKVAGIVFLDAAHPRSFEDQEAEAVTKRDRIMSKVLSLAAHLGLTRLYNPLFDANSIHLRLLPEKIKKQLLYLSHLPQSYQTFLLELDSFDTSAAQAAKVADLGDTPVVIITATSTEGLPDNWNQEEFIAKKITLQEELVALTTCGRQELVTEAGHITLVTDQQYADWVAGEIFQLIQELAKKRDY